MPKKKKEEISLVNAVWKNDVELVEKKLKKGEDPDQHDEDFNCPLTIAAQKGNLEIIKLLIEAGADIDRKDGYPERMFWEKVYVYGNRTAIGHAARNGHIEVVSYLIEAGANFNIMDVDGTSPLQWAIKKNHQPIVDLLLENGAKATTRGSNRDRQLVMEFIKGKDQKKMRRLLEDGANANMIVDDDETLLIKAITDNDLDSLLLFLEFGAKVDCTTTGMRATHDPVENSPLKHACWSNFPEAIGPLVEAGEDPNQKDQHGKPLIFWECGRGRFEVVKALVEAGADVHVKDGYDATILMAVPHSWHPGNFKKWPEDDLKVWDTTGMKLTKYLLGLGVEVNQQDVHGYTALMRAALFGQLGIVKVLMEAGEDPYLESKQEGMAIDIARKRGMDHVVEFFEEYQKEHPPPKKKFSLKSVFKK